MKNQTEIEGPEGHDLVNSVPEGVAQPVIEWSPDGVFVNHLFLDDSDVIRATKDREPAEMVLRIALATTIGAKALNQADQACDVNYVRQMLEQHAQQTATKVGDLVTQTKATIDEHLNGNNGKALLPIRNQVAEVEKSIRDRLAEVETLLDPNHPDSDLAKALSKLRNLLDDQHVDSVPARIRATVERLAAQDGALAVSMKTVVQETIKTQLDPLREQIKSLEKEITDRKAVVDLINQTTAKGRPFEDEVFARCKPWSLAAGGWAEHVGTDNKSGDILVAFAVDGIAGIDLRIAVEARDDATAKGRKQVSEHMSKAMGQREADAGIYCARSVEALGREIGEWDEGSVGGKSWIACTFELLPVALRLVLLTQRLKQRSSSTASVDSSGIRAALDEVRTAIRRLTTIKRATTTICSTASSAALECDSLQREIDGALISIERSLST